MTSKKYVIVLRHGPTHSNETINYNSFVNFIGELVVFLNQFLIEKGLDIKNITPKVYCSPYERCMETAKLITSYLEVIRNNKKISINKNSGIARWDKKHESREKSIERATTYGNHIYEKKKSSSSDEICIYISHSSIIPALLSGIVGKKLKKFKLHTASLSIINVNNRELEIFNKSFK
jgi:broad specificity phosphatase PhoE